MTDYPLPKFHFQVEMGTESTSFTEVSGLDREIEIIEYRDGASPEFRKLKMPGMEKNSNITLKGGVTAGNNEFFDWMNTVKMHTIERRDITISLLNEEHEPVMVWKVKNAWPAKLVSTDMKADDNNVAIDLIELAHEGLVIQNEG